MLAVLETPPLKGKSMFMKLIEMFLTKSSARFGLLAAALLLGLAPQVAKAAPVDGYCTPDQVIVWNNRVHVRCATLVGSFKYFAAPTSDQAHAARVLSVINTALVAGRTLIIRYDPVDLSGAAVGCLTSDCRLIQAIGF